MTSEYERAERFAKGYIKYFKDFNPKPEDLDVFIYGFVSGINSNSFPDWDLVNIIIEEEVSDDKELYKTLLIC
ncbi:hypothetical protein KY334_03820 [Candidatus Woesearchaeota archaeon]|nr:hypothetical protein [Candidatus Woesearchaeota archaeon]